MQMITVLFSPPAWGTQQVTYPTFSTTQFTLCNYSFRSLNQLNLDFKDRYYITKYRRYDIHQNQYQFFKSRILPFFQGSTEAWKELATRDIIWTEVSERLQLFPAFTPYVILHCSREKVHQEWNSNISATSILQQERYKYLFVLLTIIVQWHSIS